MQHGIVYRAENEIFKYIGWPTVCHDENSVLYAVCSGHRICHICPYGKNYLFKSFDGGNNWTNPIIINDTVLDDRDAGIVNLGGGKMLMTYFNHPKKFYIDNAAEHSKHVANSEYVELYKELYMGAIEYLKKIPDTYDTYGSFVKLSEDYGNTWGKAIKVPVTAPHGPILLKNGKLLYVGKEFHSDCEIGKEDILSYESSDEGKTWKLLSTVKDTKGLPSYIYTEPHSIELANGRILCGIRVQDGDRITIHLCHSDDGGKTWTEPKPLGNSGSTPSFSPIVLSNFIVFLSENRKFPGSKKPTVAFFLYIVQKGSTISAPKRIAWRISWAVRTFAMPRRVYFFTRAQFSNDAL